MAKRSDSFRVPVSSKGELDKIITAYAHLGDNVTLDDVARITGIHRTRVSSNNGFLASVGVIEGGKVKKSTPIGARLGRALEHNQQEDVRRAWQEITENTQFLSDLIATVRLKRGMTQDELTAHILYAAKLGKEKRHETGARTLVEVMLGSGLIAEADGKLEVAASRERAVLPLQEEAGQDSLPDGATTSGAPALPTTPAEQITAASSTVGPSVVINIQLEIPATESEAVYNNFFRALRENLLDPRRDSR